MFPGQERNACRLEQEPNHGRQYVPVNSYPSETNEKYFSRLLSKADCM